MPHLCMWVREGTDLFDDTMNDLHDATAFSRSSVREAQTSQGPPDVKYGYVLSMKYAKSFRTQL